MSQIEKLKCIIEFIYIIRFAIFNIIIGVSILTIIDMNIWNKTGKSFLRWFWL